MPITSLDTLISAAKQSVPILKTGALTTVAGIPFSTRDVAGIPGAGSLTIGNTANGVVPTDATGGHPSINDFAGGARGVIASVDFGSSVACRLSLFDRLFEAGSYSAAALGTTTLSSQPSFASRVSLNGGAADYTNLTLWLEMNAANGATATTVQIQYTAHDGTTGRLTTVATITSYTTRRMVQMALQAGDKGVQKIEAVIIGGVTGTATFNVLIMRPLWTGRVRAVNDGDNHGFDKTSLLEIFQNSCLHLNVAADSTTGGVPELSIEIASG